MDPVQATAIGIMLAKEIISAVNKEDLTEEELSKRIAANLMRLHNVSQTIKAEMEAGGENHG